MFNGVPHHIYQFWRIVRAKPEKPNNLWVTSQDLSQILVYFDAIPNTNFLFDSRTFQKLFTFNTNEALV